MYDFGPHKVRLPSDDEAAAGAAQMLEMFSSFQDRLVGLCTDEASLVDFESVPPGSLVGSYQVPGLWMRTTGGWLMVWRKWARVTDTTAVAPASGWSVSTVDMNRSGDTVDWRVSCFRTGGTLTGGADSGLADTAIFTIPQPQFQPVGTRYAPIRTSTGMGVADVATDGSVTLTALMGTIVSQTNTAHCSGSYIGKVV